MAEISIFQDEAFGVDALLAVINEDHVVPGQIAAANLFEEGGVSNTVVQIEKDGMTLALVEAKPRGAPGQAVIGDKRSLIPFNTVHLPQVFQILADEIQGIRAVGSLTELMQVQAYVARRIEKARRQIDLTHEFQRIGAIQGLVVDADGQSVLVDIFERFGIARPDAFQMELSNEDVDISAKCIEILDMQEDALGNVTSTGAHAYCGKDYWADFISRDDVRATYLNWEAAAALRGDRRQPFEFGGITWERYRGKLAGVPFVDDDEAFVVPLGVPELFITRFAPADYMETVNTEGMPYYSKLEPMRFGKGVEGEAQSNPLHLCTRPLSVIRLTR